MLSLRQSTAADDPAPLSVSSPMATANMQCETGEREGKSRGGRNGYTYLSRERPDAGSDHRARELRDSVTAWLETDLTKLARASVTQDEWLTYRSHDSGGDSVGGARRTEARRASKNG
jgi:hypothetical protein